MQEAFKEDLSDALCDCGNSYDNFEHIFTPRLKRKRKKKKRKRGLGEIISPMLKTSELCCEPKLRGKA